MSEHTTRPNHIICGSPWFLSGDQVKVPAAGCNEWTSRTPLTRLIGYLWLGPDTSRERKMACGETKRAGHCPALEGWGQREWGRGAYHPVLVPYPEASESLLTKPPHSIASVSVSLYNNSVGVYIFHLVIVSNKMQPFLFDVTDTGLLWAMCFLLTRLEAEGLAVFLQWFGNWTT